MSDILPLLLLGVLAGLFSGLIGLGGGIIIVPALVLLFGMTQHQAQGTTLALLVPPIGLLAAWVYYRQGYVNLKSRSNYLCWLLFLAALSAPGLLPAFQTRSYRKSSV